MSFLLLVHNVFRGYEFVRNNPQLPCQDPSRGTIPNGYYRSKGIGRRLRTSGEEIFTLRMFPRMISSSSHRDSEYLG